MSRRRRRAWERYVSTLDRHRSRMLTIPWGYERAVWGWNREDVRYSKRMIHITRTPPS